VKLLDFGLAKDQSATAGAGWSEGETAVSLRTAPGTVLRTAPGMVMGTAPGMVMGTAPYMAPEQVRGEAVDHRSDIFSFGAVLYEMLSGKRAFAAESSVETMTAILKSDPPELDLTTMKISPGLARIVRHCLEKRPADRFQSARDLTFALAAPGNDHLEGRAQSEPQACCGRKPVPLRRLSQAGCERSAAPLDR
jgi:serine/threonine protein kinase